MSSRAPLVDDPLATGADRQRTARQRLVPEIGDAGQRRLSGARFLAEALPGDAAETARRYLARAGLRESSEGIPLRAPRPAAPGAGTLQGALAAVEALKAVLEVGRPFGGWPPEGPFPPEEGR